MMSFKSGFTALFVVLLSYSGPALGQACTTLGQTPATAFPVCGTTTFHQNNVPICSTNDLFVPGCSDDGALYANKNPFWYKFHCYTAGSLGFVITPTNQDDDYDWQLYDITGLAPDQVFTNTSIIVTGNWSGSSGNTGASATGANFIQCASNPATEVTPTFSSMPALIEGHDYILLVSHYTDSQSGYSLSFGGGTAVITDPLDPHLGTAKTDCDGMELVIKLNKKMRCNSLMADGSDFRLLPAAANVISAVTTTCTSGFEMTEVTIRLSGPLPGGAYQLLVRDGGDGNTLTDACGRTIPVDEAIGFTHVVPIPIFADSIGAPGCAPQSVKIFFPKKIACSTIAPDGSDFAVAGPYPVTVTSAVGNCVGGEAEFITINFNAPLYLKGNWILTLKTGVDGSTIVDECGLELPTQSLPFVTADTVSAEFTYASSLDCRFNTLTFSHDGAHDVNSWNWIFNNSSSITTSSHTIVFPASSTNSVQLAVSNGTCSDVVSKVVSMDNEVKALFEMPDIICPEDPLEIKNLSTGLIDSYQWSYGSVGTSNVEDPAPFQFPYTTNDAFYSIRLICSNTTLNCSDTMIKRLRVLNNCFIAVPTAFTPNGDGLNDYLYPNNAIKAVDMEFRVFNRWGQMVFQSKEWTKKWDGKIKGIPQNAGVFVWYLSYKRIDSDQRVFQKGTTTLIR